MEFLVQLELRVGDVWKPAARYDNAHGFAHRDILDANGGLVKKKALKLGTLAEALEFAERDLSDRAEWYAEEFRKMRRRRKRS